MRVYEPSLRVFRDALGPRVEVAFASLPPAAAAITIVRTSAIARSSRTQTLNVRGAVRKPVSGVVAVLDYEVPFDVECTYRAVAYNMAGAEIAETGASTITVAAESQDHARIHNPLDPSTSVLIRFEASAVPKRSRHFGGQVVQPLGRRTGALVTSGRSGYRSLALDVIAETVGQSEQLENIFGLGGVQRLPALCVRVPQSHYRMRLPPVLFVAVLTPDPEPFATDDAEIWRLVGDEISPPAPALVMPILSRDDIDAAYATRNAVDADNATRYAVSTRYDLAGGAG